MPPFCKFVSNDSITFCLASFCVINIVTWLSWKQTSMKNIIEIYTFSFKKIHLKVPSGKWRPFCLGLNVLQVAPF